MHHGQNRGSKTRKLSQKRALNENKGKLKRIAEMGGNL